MQCAWFSYLQLVQICNFSGELWNPCYHPFINCKANDIIRATEVNDCTTSIQNDTIYLGEVQNGYIGPKLVVLPSSTGVKLYRQEELLQIHAESVLSLFHTQTVLSVRHAQTVLSTLLSKEAWSADDFNNIPSTSYTYDSDNTNNDL
jgi:hypothetical protein